MAKNRESNFDLLRILSAFAVVMLHVSGNFLACEENVPTNCHFPIMLINHIVRFAVPCFFMLSGAFILADERNADYKYFYKKSFRNIGITSGIFCMLYVIFGVAKLLAGVFIFKRHGTDHVLPGLISVFKNIVAGSPYYHLWYLFTLLGLYLAIPFVIRLAADLRGGGKPIRQYNRGISCCCKLKLHNQQAYSEVGYRLAILLFKLFLDGV